MGFVSHTRSLCFFRGIRKSVDADKEKAVVTAHAGFIEFLELMRTELAESYRVEPGRTILEMKGFVAESVESACRGYSVFRS